MFRPVIIVLIICALKILWIEVYAQHKEIPSGVVVENVPCTHLTSQSYCLYLPGYYDDTKAWPAIYIFEPFANGPLAVNSYKYAAEKLGYILIASNNSRNGSWEVSVQAADAMVTDTFSKFSIDPNQVYLSGFSGGSRVASALACINDQVAGVTGCGAGFSPSLMPASGMTWKYAGIVGNRDMNFHDQLNAKAVLDSLQMENALIIYEGEHEWPDSETLLKGLEWMHLNAMRNKKRVLDENFVQAKFKADLAFIETLDTPGNERETHDRLVQMKKAFHGLCDTKAIEEAIKVLENSKAYNRSQKKIMSIYKDEHFLLNNLLTALAGLPQSRTDTVFRKYWKNELRRLLHQTHSKDKEKANMAMRVLNNVAYNCAEFTIQALPGNLKVALLYSTYWLQIQPENFWAYWNSAKIHAMLKKENAAIRQLYKASEKGKLTIDLLKSEPAFSDLYNKRDFQDLLQQLPIAKPH